MTDFNEQVIDLCRRLIMTKSYSGGEEGVSRVLREYMLSHGYDNVYTDCYGNTVGVINGKKSGPTVLFDGHMDTVPVGDESAWKHDPFGAQIEDGKIYGRGATDMKGALAAMACAGAKFAEDTQKDFAGRICVAGVVHEECFEGVAAREISKNFKPDYVVIGEASELNIKIGQRGRAEIVIETFGVPAHSANPEKGVNAVYSMCKVVQAIRHLKPEEHPVLGKGILELTDIKSSPYPGASVVPEYCRATYDRRLLTGETAQSVLEPINRLLEEMMAKDSTLKAKASYATATQRCYTGSDISAQRFFPGWLYSKDAPFIQAILQQIRAAGIEPEITQYNFCTNGSHYAGEAGIATVGIGPSKENLAHTIDEYIELEQLQKVAQEYIAVMRALNV